MNPGQRIHAIRLSEKIDKNRQYCNTIVIEVVNKKNICCKTEEK